jgi:hypothetical protein
MTFACSSDTYTVSAFAMAVIVHSAANRHRGAAERGSRFGIGQFNV